MAKTMDKTVIIVSAVVGSLGLLSAILGFVASSAYGSIVKGYYYYSGGWWYYYYYTRTNSAWGLRISASVLLLASQITVSAISGCCGCCKSRAIPSETKRIVGVVCAVFSWILTVIALVLFLLVTGSGGAFAGGGVVVLIATALGITSFIMTRSSPVAVEDGVASNRPSVQQSPMALLDHLPPNGAAGAQSSPDVQPVPAEIAMGHPLSSPVAVAVAANNQEGKQASAPEVVPIGHLQSQPAAVALAPDGTVIRPRDVPLHTAGTTSQPQHFPQPQVFVSQQQLQQHPVQPQEPLATLPQGIKPEKKQTSIGEQMLKKGAEFGVESLVETIFSDNTDPLAMAADTILSSMTTAAAGAVDSGDATC